MGEFEWFAQASESERRAFHNRRSGEAAKNRGLKILREGHESVGQAMESNMPAGGTLSPVGDLGELKQLEALKIFPTLRKQTEHIKRASRKLPAPKGWLK